MTPPEAVPDALGRLRARFLALVGWRRVAVLVLLGAVAALALPPVPCVAAADRCLPAALLGDRSERAAARRLLDRLLVCTRPFHRRPLLDRAFDAARSAAVRLDDSVRGLRSCGLARPVRGGCGAGNARLAAIRRLARIIVFAVAWVVAEWLRSWVMSGFPWNLIGYSWAAFDPMMQLASIVGAYGVGFVTVLVATLPATLAGPKGRVLPTIVAVGVLVAAAGFGFWRLGGCRFGNRAGHQAAHRAAQHPADAQERSGTAPGQFRAPSRADPARPRASTTSRM